LSRRRDSLSPQFVEPFKEAGCDGIVYGDHIIGRGAELFGPYPGNRGRGDRLEAAREN